MENAISKNKQAGGIIGKVLLGTFILIVLAVVGLIMLGSSSEKRTAQESRTNSGTSGDTSSTAPAAPAAKIGDTVTDKDLAFIVTGVTTAPNLGNQFTKATAQGVFHLITIKIDNTSKETQTIDSSMLQVVDSQGRTFDRSSEGQTAKGLSEGKVDLFLQQVQPGLSVTGDIVFDLPKDATGLQLIVKGSYFSSGSKINLQ